MPELENSTAKRVGHAKRQDETGGVSDHLLQRESHYSLLNAVAVVVTIVAILIIVLPVVRVPGRERRLLKTMQLAIGEFITDSSQGLPPSPRV